MINIKSLYKHYGTNVALSNVELSLPKGEIIGLFGENGAGKTTLMKCILGFVPYRGEITLDNEPITAKNITRISFATNEHSFIPNLTASAHRDFYAAHFPNFNDKRYSGLMEFFELPKSKPIKGFSTGQKNQFEIILALSQGAEYILMDEPFAGNDIFNREDFYKVLLGILTENETVLLSTHLIEEVSDFIGRAILIRKGKIAGDITVSELEESRLSLIGYIKETYNYSPGRVSRALSKLNSDDEAGIDGGGI